MTRACTSLPLRGTWDSATSRLDFVRCLQLFYAGFEFPHVYDCPLEYLNISKLFYRPLDTHL